MAVVFVPSLMRDLTGGQATVSVPGKTLRQVINNLEAAYPGMRARLIDEAEDRVNPALSVIVDGVTTRLGLIHPVRDSSEIHFVPAISGGGRPNPLSPFPAREGGTPSRRPREEAPRSQAVRGTLLAIASRAGSPLRAGEPGTHEVGGGVRFPGTILVVRMVA